MVKQWLVLLTVCLSLATYQYTEGWSSRSDVLRQISTTNIPFHRRGYSYPFLQARCNSSPSSFLYAQNDKGDPSSDVITVLYNDDAFGLVFLSAFFVVNDYTFAACFGVLSMVAALLVSLEA